MNPLLAGATAFFLTAAGLAVAQTPPLAPPPGGPGGYGPGRAMMRADANGDGVITRQEAIDEATKRFDRMDANHDGKLDAAELQAMGGRGRGMRGGGDMPPPPGTPPQE